MEFKTTVSFSICWDGEEISDILKKLKALKSYVIKYYENYHFIAYQDENVFSSVEELDLIFEKFIQYVELNLKHNSDGELELDPGKFEPNLIDLEDDGDVEYTNSFNINYDYIYIYLTTLDWYSSELERLIPENMGISCEMNDYDGDYYYFDI
jgi:hypothetical protein|uniref:hypothetical protein n=1 Tax=Algoriphagus sp. TaxID=1872435 RepID=UPI0040485E1F